MATRALVGTSLLALCLAAHAARAQAPVARINCGGGTITLSTGETFLGEHPYGAPPSAGFVGGAPVQVISAHNGHWVGGWQDPHAVLHADAREGWQAYRVDVAPGNYVVRLHFAEVTLHGPQLRVFDVAIEGVPVLADLDLAARFGIQYATTFAVPVSVTDGRIDITAGGADPATLSAIEVFTAPASQPAPAAVSGLSARASYGRNVLTWTAQASPLVTGYRVYRAPSAAGPFTPLTDTWAAPARWIDADVLPGETWFYEVSALNAAGAEGPPGAPVSATVLDVATTTLPVYEITIDPANLKIIDEVILSDPKKTVPAVFTAEGQSWNVEVRYRGASSRMFSKKSWKVKFPSSHPFHGQTNLNLKAYFGDASLLHDSLSMDLAHAIGHPAANHDPLHLRVNGVYRGVFSSVEDLAENYLQARDRDPSTALFEADGIYTKQPDLAGYQLHYEKQTNAGSYDDLIAFIDLINDTPDAGFPSAIAVALDVDNLLTYYAMVGFLADEDSARHNTYLLHDPSLERWELLTWDNDGAWGDVFGGLNALMSIAFGTPDGNIITWNKLKTRVLAVPAFRWRYCEKLRALMDGPLSVPAVQQAATAGHAPIATDGDADTAKYGWESNAPFAASVGTLVQFAIDRHAFVNTELADYQPAAPPTQVWINEFMADNGGTLADEHGDFDDWIELYNAGGSPANVGGFYLTHDLASPLQWRLPAGTIIAPQGRLLVWADGEPAQGPLHASFTLAAHGDELGFFGPDGATLLDFYDFRPQLRGVSEGRIPDGGAFLRLLPTPTPGAANTAAGNLPPIITWVQNEPAVVTSNDTVTISCQVTDADGVAQVQLHASAGGGPETTLAMSPTGADRYEALLGPQPVGTTVVYWIDATDAAGGHAAKPNAAPADTFSYAVAAPQPIGVRIAEILADNEGLNADEAGDFEDWVELVNTTAAAIDLGGLHLTDNFGQPTAWAFPEGTVIGPHASLLVWADSEPAEGTLHAVFKLSKSGEATALFHADGATLVDGFTFGAQKTNTGFGRMPDGADALVELLDPSPGAANLLPATEHRRFDRDNIALKGVALAGSGRAEVGGSVSWTVTSAAPDGNGLLLVGLLTTVAPTLAKGTLLVAPILTLPFGTDAGGGATITIPVPNDPALEQVTLYVQAFVSGKGLGNAVATTLGP